MILHTIVPLDMIFPEEVAPGEYSDIEGGLTETFINKEGRKQIRRIISTDPMLYLKGDFSPGSFIDKK